MRKNLKKTLLTLLAVMTLTVIFCFGVGALSWSEYYSGDFICYDHGDYIRITGIRDTVSGKVVIPEEVNGKPVEDVDISEYENSSVTEIVLPKALKYGVSLYELKNLKKVHLGKDYKYNWDNFGSAEILVDADNPNVKVVDGVLFSKDLKHLYIYPKNKTDKHYDVPYGVEKIHTPLNEYVESVYIPKTVKEIDFYFMASSKNITKVAVDSLESWFEIGMFWDDYESYCSQYYDLYINNKIVKNLVVPEGITSIPAKAFYHCRSIESVSLPKSLKSIGASAFYGTTWYENLPEGEIVYSGEFALEIKNGYLYDKNSISLKEGVKYIADKAFYYSSSVSKVMLPSGLKRIGENAFLNCENLKEIVIPETVEYIGEHAFGYIAGHYAGMDDTYSKYDENFVIKGAKGSAAEKYAKDNGFKFVEYNPHTHSYTSKTTKGATCTATGVKTYTCSCGDKYTKSIAKLGHKYSSTYTVDKKATCTAEGSKSKHCTRCSAKTSVTAIAKLAHTYSEYVYNNDATYVADGTKTAKCSACSAQSTITAEGTKLTLATTSKVSSTKTTTSATLKWNAVEGATGYRVFQKVNDKWKTLTDTTKLTYTVKSLNAGTKYTFAVRAYVLDGDKKVMAPKYKSLAVTTSSSAKPAQVKNVKATPTATTVKLTWSKISGVKGYEIFSYNSKTKKYTSLGKTTGTSYTVKKLKSNTAYQYAVRAYAVSGKKTVYGKVSSVVKVTTLLATPTVKITSTKGKANLTWTNIAGESGYAIYMATSKNGKYTHLANYKANSTKATKSKLTSGKTYYFKIRAYKKASGKTTYSAYSAVKSVKIK